VDEDTEIIQGNYSLLDRTKIEPSHFKSCFISAVLCILAKTMLNADRFCDNILDYLIFPANSIDQQIGKLRYNGYRTFYLKIIVLDTSFNIILKEIIYANPESSPSDELDAVINKFLENNQTGILVLANCAYAFWTADDKYYLFDPYPCDEKGKANEEGYCCLMRFRNLKSMLDRIKENAGKTARKPFRIYSVSVIYPEMKKRKRRKGIKRRPKLEEVTKELISSEEKLAVSMPTVKSEVSLIELVKWVTEGPELDPHCDVTMAGFIPMRYYKASVLDKVVLEDNITTPTLAPFELLEAQDSVKMEKVRIIPFERIFYNNSSIQIPIDLCIMAWSLIHEPASWSERTIDGLIEAANDYAYDSMLANEDTSVSDMIDAVLPEFEIANYVFRAVFAPLHYGFLYTEKGWNLAMTLEKIFETAIYTGGIIVCHSAHIGVTKCGKNYFAWWTVTGTKNLRIIVTSSFDEFLKLIVKVINVPQTIGFTVRAITISHALKIAPDFSDVKGLHEPRVTMASLPEIYRKELQDSYDAKTIFKPIALASKPIFIFGTVALRNRDSLLEPRMKRCYFTALLAVVVKRDIVQSPLPGMIDRILEVAENLYRGFPAESKFHAEHILRNVPLMNRFFDLRDCALPLVVLTTNSQTGRNDFYVQVSVENKKENYFSSAFLFFFVKME